jgi:hypothetical protein
VLIKLAPLAAVLELLLLDEPQAPSSRAVSATAATVLIDLISTPPLFV